jgi:hypothetical protein
MLVIGHNSASLQGVCNPRILRCRFRDNAALLGGGVYFSGGSRDHPLFDNCEWTGNVASPRSTNGALDSVEFGNGGAFFNAFGAENSPPVNPNGGNPEVPIGGARIENSLFHSNIADGKGGALRATFSTSPELINCTISLNSANTTPVGGAGGVSHDGAPCGEPAEAALGFFATRFVSSIAWGNTGFGAGHFAQIDGPRHHQLFLCPEPYCPAMRR